MRKTIFRMWYKPFIYNDNINRYVDLCDKDNEHLKWNWNFDYHFWKYVCGSDKGDIIVERALPYHLYEITRMALK